jgi:hypothetical protein
MIPRREFARRMKSITHKSGAMKYQPDQARIVFLFSDTGGGHRSAASAIIEALELEFPDRLFVK